MSPWQEAEMNPAEKFRTVAFTIPLNNNIGVKSTRAVESQVITKLKSFTIWNWLNLNILTTDFAGC